MTTVTAAKRKRTTTKTWVNNAVKQLKEWVEDSTEEVSEEDFERAVANYERRLSEWEEAQAAFEAVAEEEQLDDIMAEAHEHRVVVENERRRLVAKWRKAHATREQTTASSHTSEASRSVKLPKLDLPKFHGDVLRFSPFWQQFEACVDKEDLPEISKYNYLVSLLRGDARTLLDGLPVTAENYQEAKKLLKAKYGRKELIVFAHVQELLSLEMPGVNEDPSASNLSKAYDKLKANVRSLEAQEVKADQFGVILTPIIVSRLPADIRMEWARGSETKEGDMEHLMDFLEQEIRRRERCVTFGGLQTTSLPKSQPKDKQGRHRPGTAAALNSQGSSCLFCGKKHETSKCRDYLGNTVQARKQKLMDKGICLKCLKKGHGALLLIRFLHYRKNHAGVQSMITAAREEYEIFGVRQMAKQVKRSCVACQRFDSRACNEEAAPLPSARVTMAPVFSVTGIDMAGPVYCSDFPGKKFYICLFVCGVVRALHLELVESLSTEDFVMAFRRFAALKRVPSVVYSDNGKNFVGGQRVLTSYLGSLAPTWRFNCPRAPWWGGWWERLVRSVKNAIKKTVRSESLSRVELCTCLCEVAASINSRPLTFVGTDTETPVALTPNHFLSGQGQQGLESRVTEDPENVSEESLSKRHMEMLERAEEFWRVWSSEYLRNLPAAIQSLRKSGNAEVGSVVLIQEDGMSRMNWCLGLIVKLHFGKDGVPRAADIKTTKGIKTRAIQKLHRLELGQDENVIVEATNDQVELQVPESAPESIRKPARSTKLPSRLKDYVL